MATASSQRRHRRACILALPAITILTGCGRAPSFSILGAYFPAWLLCIACGIGGASLFASLLTRWGRESLICWSIIVYPCMAAWIAFSLWLVIFA